MRRTESEKQSPIAITPEGPDVLRRLQRRDWANRAAQSGCYGTDWLASWRFVFCPGLLDHLLGEFAPPERGDLQRLAHWISVPVAEEEESELTTDLELLSGAPTRPHDQATCRAGALYLLARLGEELAWKERRMWEEQRWGPDGRDQVVQRVWLELFGTDPVSAGRKMRTLYKDVVTQSFSGVATVLRLPPSVGRDLGQRGGEQLDLLGVGAHLDLATRVLETSGEPLRVLLRSVGTSTWPRIRPCVLSHTVWGEALKQIEGRGAPHDREDTYLAAADLAIWMRIQATLQRGELPVSELALPGWSIVTANLRRMRGQLRKVLATDPTHLVEMVTKLPHLWVRTRTALARWAWAWAWREARTGFGFGLDGLKVTPCRPPPPSIRSSGLEEQRVQTFLLMVIGRGSWQDLLLWIEGNESTEVGKSFYRLLRSLPDEVVDLSREGSRVRSYVRLKDTLADGGLTSFIPGILEIAQPVIRVQEGRRMKEQLHQVLYPVWHHQTLPLPKHHLPGFRREFELWARRHGGELP